MAIESSVDIMQSKHDGGIHVFVIVSVLTHPIRINYGHIYNNNNKSSVNSIRYAKNQFDNLISISFKILLAKITIQSLSLITPAAIDQLRSARKRDKNIFNSFIIRSFFLALNVFSFIWTINGFIQYAPIAHTHTQIPVECLSKQLLVSYM